MTSTTAPSVEQVAPGIKTRADAGAFDGTIKLGIGLGAVLLIASAAGSGWSHDFLFAYLVAYMFGLSIALGSMFFVLVQHITRAGWSVVVRRIAENMMSTLPWFALLFIPIAIAAPHIYHHWWHAGEYGPDHPMHDAVVYGKSGYLNPTFFYVRAVIYFGVWIAIARYFRNASVGQDQSGDPEVTLRLARRAAPGLVLFALTITFAALDWIMTIDPHWFSTMFGVTYFAGSVMAMYATLAVMCLWLRGKGYLKDVVNAEHYHDIGKLLFAFMVFWTYVNFSQYMLIYYANLPEETLWYQLRAKENWSVIGAILIFGHFLAPFGFMMSRHVKRNRPLLTFSAIWLLVMHWLDLQYLIMPQHKYDEFGAGHAGFAPTWVDYTTMIGMLALFVGLALRASANVPLIPERDPRLRESLKFQNI